MGPTKDLVLLTLIFIAVDFVLGIMASNKRAKRANIKWHFESLKAWRTVYKAVFASLTILLFFTFEKVILHFHTWHLTNYACAFICGVELWSMLENMAYISEHKLFIWLRQFVKDKVKKELELSDEYDPTNEKQNAA